MHVVGAKFIFLASCLSEASAAARWQDVSRAAPVAASDSAPSVQIGWGGGRNEFGPYDVAVSPANRREASSGSYNLL